MPSTSYCPAQGRSRVYTMLERFWLDDLQNCIRKAQLDTTRMSGNPTALFLLLC